MPTPKVVVVGAGYAGLNATLRLADLRNERKKAFDIALVDQHPYHLVKIRLHEAAIRSVDITNPLDEILADDEVTVHQAAITGLDLGERCVSAGRDAAAVFPVR